MFLNYMLFYCSICATLLQTNAVFNSSPNKFVLYFLEQRLEFTKCYNAQKEKSTLPSTCGHEFEKSGSFMHNVEDILHHECDLVDSLQGSARNTNQIGDEELVDFIVVGSGTGGSVVAGRLATTPHEWKVALLEAGGPHSTASMVPGNYFRYSNSRSSINWDFELEPDANACLGWENGRCRIPRGKVLGGTGVLHGMMYMRGHRYDYDRWAAEGNEGWGYWDVLPYFKLSERNTQIGDTYSKCGTCRMGTKADNSVVDSELRVHGIQNLRVIDASIMPHVISGNINAPIMMIADKGAEFIQNTWS